MTGCRPAAAVLLVLVVALVSAHSEIREKSDPLCAAAKCTDAEVCVVKDGEPQCISKVKLVKLAKKHGIHHFRKHPLKPHEPLETHQPHHPHEQHQPHQRRQPHQKYQKHEEHAQHDRLGERQCSHAELLSMGGRLLQWFSDMHRINSGREKALPDHKVACRNDVAWMFEQWDGDNDGLLSKKELMPLEGNGRESCLAQFIDMCDDMVVDGQISVDEWCDCFSFADDIRHEPPCHKEKHLIDPHLTGVFLPRCDLEGYYSPEQCHNGFCWCVDRFGREFDHSRTKGELPDCGQYANELNDEEKSDLKHRL